MNKKLDRVYYIEIRPNQMDKMKELCIEYGIPDNGAFTNAPSYHFMWGIGPEGLIFFTLSEFLSKPTDFKSIEELEEFLEKELGNRNRA